MEITPGVSFGKYSRLPTARELLAVKTVKTVVCTFEQFATLCVCVEFSGVLARIGQARNMSWEKGGGARKTGRGAIKRGQTRGTGPFTCGS